MLQGQRNWPVREKNTTKSYVMDFNVRNIEIFERRNKYKEPCIKGIPDNDEQIQQWITQKINCKPPYWNSSSEMPPCSNRHELKKANDFILSALDRGIKSLDRKEKVPCRSIEKIQYDFRDIDMENNDGSPKVQIDVNFRESTYKEIKNIRSMDLQGLIGNSNKKNCFEKLLQPVIILPNAII